MSLSTGYDEVLVDSEHILWHVIAFLVLIVYNRLDTLTTSLPISNLQYNVSLGQESSFGTLYMPKVLHIVRNQETAI